MNKALVVFISLLPACAMTAQDATVTAQAAQTVADASQAVQAETVGEVLTQNINIPLHYMMLFGAACTFVPNPFQMVGRVFKMLFGGILEVWKLFRGKL